MSNLAFAPSIETSFYKPSCNTFTIPKDKTVGHNPLYTASGVRKAKAAEPIRTLENVIKTYNTLLTLSNRKLVCKRNAALFYFGINTGLRFQSIASVKVRDVVHPDFSVKNSFDVYEAKTGKRNTRVITPQLKAVLEDYIASYNIKTSKNMKPKPLKLNDYLFPNQTYHNKPVDRDGYYEILNQATSAANISGNIGTHTMRKTYAYFIIKSNPNNIQVMNCLMKLFNHSSERVTLMYAGITQDQTDEISYKLSSLYEAGTTQALEEVITASSTTDPIKDSKIDRIIELLTADEDDDED